jgi:hypothetical protein
MALYKYSQYLSKSDHSAFDGSHAPGISAPYPGIYRCTGCGKEIATAAAHTLPPQTHHTHTAAQGRIAWQLTVSHS